MLNEGTDTPSRNSPNGTARSPSYPSARPLSSGIAYTSNPGIWLPGTVNLRLGAVRRLAYEASDCGLLGPDLAAGIRRVKGGKKIGARLGNWLTPEQSERLWNAPDYQLLKGKRDRALLAVLLARGLRRHAAVSLDLRHVQQREDHWAIVDLKDKAGHTRTVPMPGWVKAMLDDWLQAANLTAGKLFRRVNRPGKPGAMD